MDWVSIGIELNRNPDKCLRRWGTLQTSLQATSLKTGALAPEENAMRFTPSMDARLLEAVQMFTIDGETNYVKVAAHVGGGMTNAQCHKRYRYKLDPALQLLNNDPWTEGEVTTTPRPPTHHTSHFPLPTPSLTPSNLLPLNSHTSGSQSGWKN
ncbi:hypothetical protein B484DRAFT_290740 [Ochromonadaceae sp. CCMP2298]|nr:hypothetical protein B484DRAFT_290740 [Ochromonadaceae sp. CCMP2298]